MIELKHCAGCHDNYYNPNCWSRETGKMVWRICIGIDEQPPYKNKKSKRVPSCYHGGGSNRIVMIKKEALTSDGYWKWL